MPGNQKIIAEWNINTPCSAAQSGKEQWNEGQVEKCESQYAMCDAQWSIQHPARTSSGQHQHRRNYDRKFKAEEWIDEQLPLNR
jgi:hypothetical protein